MPNWNDYSHYGVVDILVDIQQYNFVKFNVTISGWYNKIVLKLWALSGQVSGSLTEPLLLQLPHPDSTNGDTYKFIKSQVHSKLYSWWHSPSARLVF